MESRPKLFKVSSMGKRYLCLIRLRRDQRLSGASDQITFHHPRLQGSSSRLVVVFGTESFVVQIEFHFFQKCALLCVCVCVFPSGAGPKINPIFISDLINNTVSSGDGKIEEIRFLEN